MAGCGYVCPQCEGKGLLEDGSVCDWCNHSTITSSFTMKQDEDCKYFQYIRLNIK
jgi:hypothetical protein